ncbi:hypothetical protein [Streptomyces roseolus]|uniref:hypothetical protein n=1 Tax=Streptomyces roseolus TaxID=67358 RepID=UPI0036532645
MADAKEWFEVNGETYPNLEEATEGARSYAMVMDRAVDIFRVTAVPVRCIQREISLKETDLPVTPEA